jgi:hypothetical protein
MEEALVPKGGNYLALSSKNFINAIDVLPARAPIYVPESRSFIMDLDLLSEGEATLKPMRISNQRADLPLGMGI